MSKHDSSLLHFNNKFITPYIGGDLDEDANFIKNRFTDQQELLQNEKQLHSQTRYDPYIGYLDNQGLLDKNKNVKYVRHAINIDSRHRNKKPIVDTDESYILDQDPIQFIKDSNKLFIKHIDGNLSVGDKITLTGIRGLTTIVRTKFSKKQSDNTLKEGVQLFQFLKNSKLVRINHPHHLDINNKKTVAQIEISGVKGNITNSYLENIPINVLNAKHIIIIPNIENADHLPFMNIELAEIDNIINDTARGIALTNFLKSFFFILLPLPFIGSFNPKNYNVVFKFLSIAGIPLNQLNAEYPVDVNHMNGFHIVQSVTNNGFYIALDDYKSVISCWGGGSSIEIAKITNIVSGYVYPQEYSIDLGRNFYNIVMARLISSEFPNTERGIKDFPTNKANNKIYWQNLDDGDHIYSIEIDAGNYNPEELGAIIEKKFATVKRINKSSDNKYIAPHTQNHYMQISIDTRSDIVTFKSFRESILSKPIVDVFPDIQENPNLDPDFDLLGITDFEITFEHKNHRLNVGDTILVKSAISHMGIPANVINVEHTISEIVSTDRYKIKLSRFNLAASRYNTGGGLSVAIYTPNIFKLRFDLPDTMGNLLGFRNVGDPESITQYNTQISNTDPYEFDIFKTKLGTPLTLTHNSVQLSGDNYILMVIDQFVTKNTNILDTGPVKEAFAKILLTDIPGNTLFNTFVSMSMVFQDPISSISQLDLKFYSPDGSLYDFNNVDHSFTLELMTKEEIPDDSGISAKTGRRIVDARKEANIE
jgi:hypothetical protein